MAVAVAVWAATVSVGPTVADGVRVGVKVRVAVELGLGEAV